MHGLHRLKLTLLATRPWSFSMTAVSVTLGNLAGLTGAPFHWGRYGLLLAGMILVHAATNVLNDYFDFRHGVDVQGAPTTRYRRHPLVEGDFTPGGILRLGLICYAVAAIIGLYFAATVGWIVIGFALVGGFISLFYTAAPIAYKYRGLGEVAVFFAWGPLMMLACHYLQTETWDRGEIVLFVSIPQGLWVALVLLADNLKDLEFDRNSRIRTLGTRFGRSHTIRVYSVLVSIIYGITLVEIVLGMMPVWGLLTLLSLPSVYSLIRRFRQEAEIPTDADPQTAKSGMVYGIMLIASFLIDLLRS